MQKTEQLELTPSDIQALEDLSARHASMGEIRGMGLMIGIQIGSTTKDVVARLLKKGIIANAAHGTVLRLLPPFIVSKKEIDAFLVSLDEVLSETESGQ
jgi:acetylornithine/succinyldiaminopimelate/putrescine aminotransferase